MSPPLYLATTSPRRRQLLRRLGIDFRLLRPAGEERPARPGTAPRQFAITSARTKALSVCDRVKTGFIVGVDTIVVPGRHILGKPKDKATARQMLTLLAGRSHQVISAVAVVTMPGRRIITATEVTTVTFRRLSRAEIAAYINTREPYDKAGAYALQGRAGLFVSSIRGCYLNVIGLPVPLLLKLLTRAGWKPKVKRR